MGDIDCWSTAREMVAAVAARRISARELMELHLARIAEVNPGVNAVVSLDEERARAGAAEADELTASGGPLGPLHGLPHAFKDTHEVAGWRTTFGSPLRANHVPKRDELVVERIRAAGVVPIGKTNVPEWAAGSHTFNPVFGTTRNPYDLSRSAGGSSGGAAAGLASGMLPLADGSDMGGSLRNPASFNNVVGLRPSVGRVPSWPSTNGWELTSVSGPMARNVEDLALLLSVLAGPSRRAPLSLEATGATFAPPLRLADLGGVRVALSTDLGGAFAVDHRVADVVAAQAAVLESLGATVEDAHPVLHGADAAFRTLRAWVFHSRFRALLDKRPDDFKASLRDNIMAGADLTGTDVARAYQQLTSIHDRMRAFFETYDVLALPVSQVPPFSADEEYPADINGVPQETYLDWMRSAYLITVTGCPAMSVPAGFTPEGWPVGIQLVGPVRGERRLLEVAHAFEQATLVGRRRPSPAVAGRGRMTRRVRVGVDTGGTFTDVVAVDEDSGALVTTKTPSTPADPAVGFMTGVHKILDTLGVGGEAVGAVSHGTTVATNRLLEGTVGSLGLVTNDGYEFLLEIARQSVPDGYGNSYFWVKPDRIVPVDRVRTVRGRLAVDGTEIRPFDLAQAAEQARWFRDRGVDTIGVCLLHSYVDDSHEVAMRDVLAREHPDATVSISSEVLREYREYERAVTTLVDAAVKPDIRRYVASIATRLAELVGTPTSLSGSSGSASGTGAVPFDVMKSNGGVLSATEVVEQPITTVLSGPAAGALGAAVVARAAGFSQVVTLDGGGTSTDVAVVRDGQPALTTEGTIGAFPCKVPMIDVVTVGAGGGSVAWLSPEGTLKVGPRSAGADPGPVCYGRGGAEPTVTDAHLVLGRIPPHLLGGEVPLDGSAAEKAVDALASDLGLSREACAGGVLEVSAWNQANALRRVTVTRGLDVRDFTMVAFGSSGSLQACRLVDLLGLDGALVPRDPGSLSAYGLLTVDVRNDYVQTAIARASALEPATVQAGYDGLTGRADAALEREGFGPDERVVERTADLRYLGQAYEVRVDVPLGPVTEDLLASVADAFHDAHRALYGYDNRGDARQEVEWVNLRVTGIGPIRTPALARVTPGAGAASARIGARPVFFDDGWVDADVYDRELLGAGDVVTGPAVLEEFSSTVPLHPGFTARVDDHGNLLIRRSAA